MEQSVINCEDDREETGFLSYILDSCNKKITVLPEYTSSFTLTSFNQHVFY